MKIVLKKNGIAVSSDRKELGLDATLPLVECKDTEQEK